MTGIPTDPRYSGGLPYVKIAAASPASAVRSSGRSARPRRSIQFSENLTWTTATHNFKFGFEKRRDKLDYVDLTRAERRR